MILLNSKSVQPYVIQGCEPVEVYDHIADNTNRSILQTVQEKAMVNNFTKNLMAKSRARLRLGKAPWQ